MRRETGSVASRVARIVIIAILSVFAALSLSGCLGFDINISTPFDKLEQRTDEVEQDGDDMVWENEDGDDDNGMIIDENGFMRDKDGNILRNPPQTNRDTNIADDEDEENGESILDYEHYHDDIDGGFVNEFVNRL